MKVDGCGFFIYWKGDGTEGDVLELSQVNDIRSGKCPNVSNDKQYLLQHGKISLSIDSCIMHDDPLSSISLEKYTPILYLHL